MCRDAGQGCKVKCSGPPEMPGATAWDRLAKPQAFLFWPRRCEEQVLLGHMPRRSLAETFLVIGTVCLVSWFTFPHAMSTVLLQGWFPVPKEPFPAGPLGKCYILDVKVVEVHFGIQMTDQFAESLVVQDLWLDLDMDARCSSRILPVGRSEVVVQMATSQKPRTLELKQLRLRNARWLGDWAATVNDLTTIQRADLGRQVGLLFQALVRGYSVLVAFAVWVLATWAHLHDAPLLGYAAVANVVLWIPEIILFQTSSLVLPWMLICLGI